MSAFLEDGIRQEYNAMRLNTDMDGARLSLVVKLRFLADAIEDRRCDPWAPWDAVEPMLIEEQNEART